MAFVEQPKEAPRQVRVIGDGTQIGIKIVDAQTGERIKNIARATIHIDAIERPTVDLVREESDTPIEETADLVGEFDLLINRMDVTEIEHVHNLRGWRLQHEQ